MKNWIRVWTLAIPAVTFVVACGPNLDRQTFIGWTKSEVRQALDEPDAVSEWPRTDGHVWGPIEDLWYGLEPGEKLVVWTYETSSGRKELYFLNDEDEVEGEFFWYRDTRRNPVFEPVLAPDRPDAADTQR